MSGMKAIHDYLKATGLNQAQFAERINVDRSTVTLWLQGKRTPTDAHLDVISARTGIKRKLLVVDKERCA